MRRRGIGGKKYGTPTVNPPEPQAIDPWSGFKIPHKDLVKQWDGNYVWDRTVDKRNPQDFVRGVKDDQTLPNPRPESPDSFVATNIIWQTGEFMTTQSGGNVLLTQGVDASDTL